MSDSTTRSHPTEVGRLLGGVLRKAGLTEGLEKATASQEWPDRVGQAIAAVTRIRSVSGSTIFVEVRSSAWLQELTFMKREILEKMNEGRGKKPFEKVVFFLAEDGLESNTAAGATVQTSRRERE